jgi:hypothetical protein
MSLARLKAEAKKLGAIVQTDNTRHWWDLRVEAPAGYVWKNGQIHEFVGGCHPGEMTWRLMAIADMAKRMEDGIEPCPFADCEWCADNAAAASPSETR